MFNPMNFGGNPAVMELLQNSSTDIDQLLQLDCFPSQFKTNNSKLISYMDDGKYRKLVSYISKLNPSQSRNKAFKFPLMAAEILSTDNVQTLQYMFREGPIFIEEVVTEQIWVEKQVDECDSEYYSSTGSNRKIEEDFEIDQQNRENVPPSRKSLPNNTNISDSEEKKMTNSANSHSERNSIGSSASITSDDFPFVDEKKVIKVKEIQTKKIVKQVKPLLQELFSYFSGQMNYTLAGYVGKVLENLLKKEAFKLLRFIYQNEKEKCILNHIQSQSISDFVSKMLLSDIASFEDRKINLYQSIQKQIVDEANSQQASKLPFLSSLICETIGKVNIELINTRKFVTSIYDQKIIENLSLVSSNKNALPSICFIIHSFLKKIESINLKDEEWKKDLKAQLIINLEPFFNDFILKMWEKMNELCLPAIGYVRIFQLLNHVLRQNLYWIHVQLQAQENIANLAIDICKKYKNNNILHVQIFQFFKLAIVNSQCSPGTIKNILQTKSFSIFLLQAINRKQLLYRGLAIQICQLIKQMPTPPLIQFKKSSTKWEKIEELLKEELNIVGQTLGGHTSRKVQKYTVLFQKEAILDLYGCFLRNELPQKIQPEEQIEDLKSSCHSSSNEWSDWNDFSNYSADEVND